MVAPSAARRSLRRINDTSLELIVYRSIGRKLLLLERIRRIAVKL